MGQIQNIIFDFDGVFYPYDGLGSEELFVEMCGKARIAAALSTFPSIKFDDLANAPEMAYEAFLDEANNRGCTDDNKLNTKAIIHAKFHENLLDALTPEMFDKLFAPIAEVKEELLALKEKGVKLAILTHSDKETWTIPLLKKFGLEDIFDPIVDYKEIKFNSKAVSGDALQYTMDLMGAKPENTAFVEDSGSNIRMAKKAHSAVTNFMIASDEAVKIEEASYKAPNLKSSLKQIAPLV